MKKKLLASLLVLLLLLAGCGNQTEAQNVSNAIGGIIAAAQDAEPSLPPNDAAIVGPWVSLAQALHAQLDTCIGSKNSQFLACFNAFAAGVLNPSELAQLNVLSPATQKSVETYAVAIILAVNAAEDYFGGTPLPTPTIAQAPTNEDLRHLAVDAHQLGAWTAYTRR